MHFAILQHVGYIYISWLVYKNIPCFFPSRAFRNCLNFLFDGFVQLHNNNLISLVFSLSNDSFFLILSDKKKGTNKIWKRDEEAFQLQRSRSIDTCEHHSKLGAKEGGEGKWATVSLSSVITLTRVDTREELRRGGARRVERVCWVAKSRTR